MQTIPSDLLDHPVDGQNLRPGTLADQFDGDTTHLLVFLRHFG